MLKDKVNSPQYLNCFEPQYHDKERKRGVFGSEYIIQTIMKILYITPIWSALKTAFNTGSIDCGMPGFFRPIVEMSKCGHQIDFILLSDMEDNSIVYQNKIELFKPESIKKVVDIRLSNGLKKYLSINSICRNLANATKDIIKDTKYDFIYGQSHFSVAALKIALVNNIPCGQRIYGTFLWSMYQKKGYLRSFLFSPLEIVSYNTKTDFLIMTDDGTNGDLAFAKFCLKKSDKHLFFWRNGVERLRRFNQNELKDASKKYGIQFPSVLYVARLQKWKRQDKALFILNELKKRDITMHLYLVGQNDEEYFEYLMKLAAKLNITNQVHYLGVLEREDCSVLANVCDFSFIMYDMSCLGNVFHELLSDGAVLICEDPSDCIKDYIVQGDNGYIVKDYMEASDVVYDVLINGNDTQSLRENARKSSIKMTYDWDTRIKNEVNLIEETVLAHK